MRLGLIGDTHGFFHKDLPERFRGVDLIIHTGDVGSLQVWEKLRGISATIGVRGNHEPEDIPGLYPEFSRIELCGLLVLLTHRLFTISWEHFKEAFSEMNSKLFKGIKVVFFGHTHFPLAEWVNGVYFFNPGYCGPDEKEADMTLGIVELSEREIEGRIIRL